MTGGGNARDGYRYTVHNDRTAYYSITFQRETKEINAEKEKLFKKYTSNRNQIAKISGDLDEINKEKMSGVAFIIAGILFLILIVGLIMIIVGARKISKSNGEMTYLRQQISKIEVDNNKILSEAKKIKE